MDLNKKIGGFIAGFTALLGLVYTITLLAGLWGDEANLVSFQIHRIEFPRIAANFPSVQGPATPENTPQINKEFDLYNIVFRNLTDNRTSINLTINSPETIIWFSKNPVEKIKLSDGRNLKIVDYVLMSSKESSITFLTEHRSDVRSNCDVTYENPIEHSDYIKRKYFRQHASILIIVAAFLALLVYPIFWLIFQNKKKIEENANKDAKDRKTVEKNQSDIDKNIKDIEITQRNTANNLERIEKNQTELEKILKKDLSITELQYVIDLKRGGEIKFGLQENINKLGRRFLQIDDVLHKHSKVINLPILKEIIIREEKRNDTVYLQKVFKEYRIPRHEIYKIKELFERTARE